MVKRKPATPLPWRATGLRDAHIYHALPSESQFERSRMLVADCIGPHDIRTADAAYIAHAANAYPRLVEALRELHAIDERKIKAIQKRPYAIGATIVQERVERNRTLLRELGEES